MNAPLSQAQEFANFARYEAQNVSLPETKPGEHRVVFMGDSITEGWSNSLPEFWESRTYVNRGISGQTTPQMLIRFRPDVIDIGADIVVILAGTNDIAGNTGPTTLQAILGNVSSMAEIAQANDIAVIICSVLPAADYPWRPGLSPNEKIPALNAMLQAYASDNDFYYLDYFGPMDDGQNGMIESLTTDGVHVTRSGYLLMSEMVEAAISETIRSSKPLPDSQ